MIVAVGDAPVDYLLPVNQLTYDSLDGRLGVMQEINENQFIELKMKGRQPIKRSSGGSGLNVLKSLASLGRRCAFVGVIGKDSEAQFLKTSYNNHGIQAHLHESNEATTRILCLISPQGKRTFRKMPGASRDLTIHQLKILNPKEIKFIHLEGYTFLKPRLSQDIFEWSKSHRIPISLDLGSSLIVEEHGNQILNLIQQGIDLLFGNEREFDILFKKIAAKELLQHCTYAIQTLGHKGARCLSSQASTVHCAPDVTVVDTTGAGDFFAGGFIHQYLNQESPMKCLECGAERSSLIVRQFGTEIKV